MAAQATTQTPTQTNNTSTAADPGANPGQSAPPQSTQTGADSSGNSSATTPPTTPANTNGDTGAADSGSGSTLQNPLAGALEEAQKLEGTAQAEGDGSPKSDAVPEKYEFKAPQGMTLNDGEIAEFSTVAKSLGLSQDKAQKLVDLSLKFEAAREQQRNQKLTEWMQKNLDELAKDPDPKGRNTMAAKAFMAVKGKMSAADSSEMQNLIFGQDSWLGSHPAFVRFLAAIGALVSEDRLPTGEGATGASKPGYFERLYSKVT